MTHHTRRILEQFALAAGWTLAAIGWTVAGILAWYFSTEPALSATPRHGLHHEMPARPTQRPPETRKSETGTQPCLSVRNAPVEPEIGFVRVSEPAPGSDCRPVRIAEPGTVLLVLGGLVVLGRWA